MFIVTTRCVSPKLTRVINIPVRTIMSSSSLSLPYLDGMNVASRPSELIGKTPLIDLTPLLKKHNIDNGSILLGKLESLGPCSSVKDRIGRSMITDAETRGLITPGKTVLVEPTSGNTGIALAFIARERNYRCILVMPETMSIERRMMLLALGAEVVLTPKETAVAGAIAKAQEIVTNLNGTGYTLQQFENNANPQAHIESTGPEIWNDTNGKIDIFISGVGTGGTITGVSQYIKGSSEKNLPALNSNLTTVAIEPLEQLIITEAKGFGLKTDSPQGPHKIQGMGAGILPKILDLSIIDVVIPIHSDEAMEMTNELWLMGLPTGVSAGAIVAGSIKELQKDTSANKIAVCIIPSFGERYFTHPMFDTIKHTAETLTKQPLPEPYDNTLYGFSSVRG